MTVGKYCNREVLVVEKDESVRNAANLMRAYHAGDVVVVDKRGEQRVPIGILTDRDIVIEILAEDVDLSSVNVGDVMSYKLVTANEEDELLDAVKTMRNKGVRRMPVVNKQGGLVGILTVDDMLELIMEQLSNIVELIVKEQDQEIKKCG